MVIVAIIARTTLWNAWRRIEGHGHEKNEYVRHPMQKCVHGKHNVAAKQVSPFWVIHVSNLTHHIGWLAGK